MQARLVARDPEPVARPRQPLRHRVEIGAIRLHLPGESHGFRKAETIKRAIEEAESPAGRAITAGGDATR